MYVSTPTTRDFAWSQLLFPWRIIRHLAQYKDLLRQLCRREIFQRYRGSYLGFLWPLLNPMLMLAIYMVVFGFIFNGRFTNSPQETRIDFALGLFCGLGLFNFVAEALGRAPTLVIANANYVTKVVFPLETLGISAIAAPLLDALMSLVLLLAGLLYWHGSIPLTALYLPLIFAPLVALSLGIVWILASAGVFIRDIAVVVVPVTAVLMYASAIFYPLEKVPPAFSPIVHLNPLALLINQARRVSILGEPLEWAPWSYAVVFGLVTFLAGYAFFMRTKRAFADVM